MFILVVAATLGLGARVTCAAATPSEAETTAQQAADRFRAGDFDAAAKLFMQAYAMSHRPDAVFNAARAYESAGKSGDAAGLFRLYVSLTDDATGVLEARQHLAKLEANASPASATEPLGQPSVRTKGVVGAGPGPSRLAVGLTTGGAFAAVAGGVALMLVGKSDSRQANAEVRRTRDLPAYDAAYGTAQAEWRTGAILTGAGAVLGGVSVYLWAKSVSVMATRQGVALSGSF